MTPSGVGARDSKKVPRAVSGCMNLSASPAADSRARLGSVARTMRNAPETPITSEVRSVRIDVPRERDLQSNEAPGAWLFFTGLLVALIEPREDGRNPAQHVSAKLVAGSSEVALP